MRGDSYERVFSRGRAFTPVYLLQEELIERTRDLSYQDHMLEDYPCYDESMKPRLVDSLGRTPVTKSSINFLRQIILTECNNTTVARAARHLLDALNVPNSTDAEKVAYNRLLSDL